MVGLRQERDDGEFQLWFLLFAAASEAFHFVLYTLGHSPTNMPIQS